MKTILVVDDEPAHAEILSLILEDLGYRVFCASNGRQGLECATQVRPDLVVLDFMMPVMDGAQMGRAMRAEGQMHHIRILMNSSVAEEVVRCHFDGYAGFLRKPYDVEVALELIADLLERDRCA